MQTQQIVASYQTEIASLDVAIGAANNARAAIEDLTRQLDALESETLLAGIDGKNVEERKARLTLTLEADGTYVAIRNEIDEQRRIVAEQERQVTLARERCRLLRLQLALVASPGVLEAVA